jgi:hypothetical protein
MYINSSRSIFCVLFTRTVSRRFKLFFNREYVASLKSDPVPLPDPGLKRQDPGPFKVDRIRQH